MLNIFLFARIAKASFKILLSNQFYKRKGPRNQNIRLTIEMEKELLNLMLYFEKNVIFQTDSTTN